MKDKTMANDFGHYAKEEEEEYGCPGLQVHAVPARKQRFCNYF
jgi:hypothetical protein